MKKFVTLFIIIICSVTFADAQTFLDHLQKKEPGKASVKVSQSKDIDELVNGKAKTATTQIGRTDKKAQDVKNVASTKDQNTPAITTKPGEKNGQKPKEGAETKHDSTARHEDKRLQNEETSTNEMDIPTIDLRKKVMRKGYKINGYRVQVYAGGNSRADRQRAEAARDIIKQTFPNEPVYVHFYSPRWICRVGNYRSYEEAAHILKQVKGLGYKQASIVRGKITVQY